LKPAEKIMGKRSTHHATFVIERDYAASPARVFAAWAELVLPSIREDLGFSETSLVWVVNAYKLTFGGFLLLGGRLGEKAIETA